MLNMAEVCTLISLISPKSVDVSLRYGDLTIFKMVAVTILNFFGKYRTFVILCCWRYLNLLLTYFRYCARYGRLQNLKEIGQSGAEMWPKSIFSIWWPSAILNF